MTYNRNSTRYFSKKQEKAVAASLGGKTTPNSGATTYKKGDVSVGGSTGADDNTWLIECKTCMQLKKSFAIKQEWLSSIKAEAISQGKLNYAVAFNFGPGQPNYYILDEKTLLGITGMDEI